MQLLALVFMVASAAAAPQFSDFNSQQQYVSNGQPDVRIESQKFDQDQVGNYEYAYRLSNGQQVQEVGRFQPGPEPETGRLEQQGSYQYIGDDGNTYQMSYVANDYGFQPEGDLPQAPAQIPEYDQLRRDYPQLFWAENGGAGIVLNDQQFDNQQFSNQQFITPQQQFIQQGQQFFI